MTGDHFKHRPIAYPGPTLNLKLGDGLWHWQTWVYYSNRYPLVICYIAIENGYL